MSADEGFLSRWSRRKAAATTREPSPQTAGRDPAPDLAATPSPPVQPEAIVDPASLPPIESLDAGSDIRAFLAPGVPVDLTRAALRRAWSADPAIRDFIGLSENAWDFTAPGGVPGFGSVTAEEVQMLLARLTGEREVSDPADAEPEPLSHGQTPIAEEAAPKRASEMPEADAERAAPFDLADANNIAVQHEFEEQEYFPPPQRRRHGGALPD